MSHAAPIRAIVLAVGLCGMMLAGPVQADSIVSVTVQPSDGISPNDEVSLAVWIQTTSAPAFLFRPFELEISEGQILIDIFIDSGLLTALSALTEVVALGTFEPGTYPFEVQIHNPRFVPPFPEDEFLGSFTVVPEPASLALLATGMVALLLRRGARRTL